MGDIAICNEVQDGGGGGKLDINICEWDVGWWAICGY